MDIEAFRKAGYQAVDAICDYYTKIREMPVNSTVEPGYLVKLLPDHAPEKGEEFSVIAKDFQEQIMPGITHWQHPSFFAFFPSITNFESILADMYATSVSNPGFNWNCSPACTELEMVVMDWAAKLFGLESVFHGSSGAGGGIILGSASEACLTVAVAARERCLRILTEEAVTSKGIQGNGKTVKDLARGTGIMTGANGARVKATQVVIPEELRARCTPNMVMYGSTHTHSIGKKAAIILGLHFRALPTYRKDEYALRADTVRQALEEDTQKGLIPFMLSTFSAEFILGLPQHLSSGESPSVATIGTTNTGTIDHIAEIGAVLKDFPTTFLHIDAAWGGVCLALPELRQTLQLDAINTYAHSFSTNFHKWGLVAFDATALWVRDRELLTSALDVTPAYLRTAQGDSGSVIDYRNWQLALGRRFRSLKVWFVLRSYGVEGYQKHLRGGLEMANLLEKMIQGSPDFELLVPKSLALLVFRYHPSDRQYSQSELNDLNKQLHATLASRGDIILTQTVLPADDGEEGTFCIRFALGNARTEEQDVIHAWNLVVRLARELRK
ncbi:hypothetical protein QFC19_005766 [Naganishia cerealis]|uniref:Uncharacterized protein n=1 Tax=Naganishia cerealis TaxID=610337 RepID=A0ACC2VLT9_9TREE|nr:hypothetical protein QFC19_005766 [Naganishia cerealis]